jgi:hypothetical protein
MKVTNDLLKNMLPLFYQTHLQQHLTRSQFLVLSILLDLLQSSRQVKLERLASAFPYPITTESRRRKLQRFLDLPKLTIGQIWYPLITYWLTTYCQAGETLSIAIDRTQWGSINILTIALVWEKRAIPLFWSLLPKLGSSNVAEQIGAISAILPLLKDYQVVVLGDREFCSVELANWLRQQRLHFCLRLKRTLCIETEPQIWEPLKEVGLIPGLSIYFAGVKVRKTQPIEGFDVACKWKRKYRGVSVKEGWFILTNLGSLTSAIAAYQKRMGIEEMFRDYKSGGYYLEGTGLKGQRLMVLILLIALAYTSASVQGTTLKRKQVKKYIIRDNEPKRKYSRRSTFGSGLDSQQWLTYLDKYAEEVQELMTLTPTKRQFYQRGMRAISQIQSRS